MAERSFYFVVVSVLFFNVEIFSQQKTPESIKLPINNSTLPNVMAKKVDQSNWRAKDNLGINDTINVKIPRYDRGLMKANSSFILTPSFYSDHLSFFCNKELKLEKLTSVPFRFRLGSLDYVNYLEQKPNALKPH